MTAMGNVVLISFRVDNPCQRQRQVWSGSSLLRSMPLKCFQKVLWLMISV